MAVPTSTHINRRTNSKSPTQSGPHQDQSQRLQRVTRSQSRDDSNHDIERKNRYIRKTKPTVPTGGDRSATAGAQRKGKLQTQNGAKALQDLLEIDENSRIEYPESPQRKPTVIKRALDSTRRQSGRYPKSPDGASAFSGTTARVSGSGDELAAGSAEEMIDALEDLFDASNKLLRLLVPSEVSQTSVQGVKHRMLDLESKETRQLQRYTRNFEAHRVVYGDDGFINVPAIVRAILDVSKAEDVRSGPWRMDPILYRANLASLATSLMTHDGEGREDTWQQLDKRFPRPFLQRFVADSTTGDLADGSALLLETFELAVDMRTRGFIESAKRLVIEQGFDPDALLEQIFYKDSNTLNGWSVAGLRFEDVNHNKDFRSSIVARLDELRKTFSETEAPFIDLERLEKILPHARLTTALIQWSQLRLQEIELQLERFGGTGGVVQAIRSTRREGGKIPLGTMDEDFSDRSNADGAFLNRQPPKPVEAKVSKATNQFKGGKDLAALIFGSPKAQPIALTRLKEREASRRSSGRPASSSPLAKTQPAPTTDMSRPSRTRLTSQMPSGTPPSWQPLVTQEEEYFAASKVDLGAQVDRIIETRQILEAESNKENVPQQEPSQILNSQSSTQSRAQFKRPRFLDHQPNAERMDWDTQESNSTSASHSQRSTLNDTRANKRSEEDDSTSDDQFQKDTRQVPRTQRSGLTKRYKQREAAPRPSPKTPRRSQNRPEMTEPSSVEESLETHNRNNNPIPSQAERYALVNERAKDQTARVAKKPQVRIPWSGEETERLLELIEEHGLSWSKLKKMDKYHQDGARLSRRDQVALKDKARNIKLDYLK
ncbi:MAG: hypothetical protein Q9211_000943 [Gyalolechia sp. 1 TL-2023]